AAPDALYVAGEFSSASGIPAANIARWDGTSWSPLGAGIDGPVFALFIDDDGDLYAGGSFAHAGGVEVSNLALWDGSGWSDVGGGVSGVGSVVKALASQPTGLLVAGLFVQTGAGAAANGLARWTGTDWVMLGGAPPGIQHDLRAITILNGTIFVGGVLRFPGTTRPPEATLARATPLVLSDYAGSANADDECAGCASVDALVTDATDLWVAGAFTRLGQVTLTGSPYEIIRLADGTVPVGPGSGSTTPTVSQGGRIRALAIAGGAVYAGGNFNTMRSVAVANVAVFDGTAWLPLGPGVSAPAHALAGWEGSIYAGGEFLSAGALEVNHVARWDGSAWQPLTGAPVPAHERTLGNVKARFR
ncbi:MAG TPA: hypothetical protein VFX92_00655, partial [Candidatus Krumholzibacteria bacterium]|nr:hypothetical protein [Candidatus Krumholzibacteria bacterium]